MKTELSRSLRTNRRGYTLVEVLVASSILMLVVGVLTSMMSLAAKVEQTVVMQGQADRSAVQAMNRIIVDTREAKEVDVVRAFQFRIYLPYQMSDGHYDRFRPDYTKYIEYVQATTDGTPRGNGSCIWRKNELGVGRIVAENISRFRVKSDTPKSISITIWAERTAPGRRLSTELTGRLLYLRNN